MLPLPSANIVFEMTYHTYTRAYIIISSSLAFSGQVLKFCAIHLKVARTLTTDKGTQPLTPVVGASVNAQRIPLDRECKDHGHVLQSNGHLTDTEVKTMRLRPLPVDEHGDGSRFHVR